MVGAGLRVGEACALDGRDLDLVARTLTVQAAKTSAGRREVELPSGLVTELWTLAATPLPLLDGLILELPAPNPCLRRRDVSPTRCERRLATTASLLAALIFPFAAAANLTNEVRQGLRLSDFLRSGQQRCSDRSADDFELIGEYAMGRYLANLEAHAAMSRRMALI